MTIKAKPRECMRCFAEIYSPKTMYCECVDCRERLTHIEQCPTCGDQTHQPGPR